MRIEYVYECSFGNCCIILTLHHCVVYDEQYIINCYIGTTGSKTLNLELNIINLLEAKDSFLSGAEVKNFWCDTRTPSCSFTA